MIQVTGVNLRWGLLGQLITMYNVQVWFSVDSHKQFEINFYMLNLFPLMYVHALFWENI